MLVIGMSERPQSWNRRGPESQRLVVASKPPPNSGQRVERRTEGFELMLRCCGILLALSILLIALAVLQHQSDVNGELWDGHRSRIYLATYAPTASMSPITQ